MATTAAPYGLKVVKLKGNRPYTNAQSVLPIASAYATAIFYGDVVKTASDGTITKDTGTTTATPVGVFLGCSYTDPNTKQLTFKQNWAASIVATDAVAYVADDPDAIFMIQADGSVAQTNVGNNAALVQTAGSAVTGNSKVALNSSSLATTATLPLRVIGFVNGPFSAVGDAFTDVLVIWNAGMHQYNNATGV